MQTDSQKIAMKEKKTEIRTAVRRQGNKNKEELEHLIN